MHGTGCEHAMPRMLVIPAHAGVCYCHRWSRLDRAYSAGNEACNNAVMGRTTPACLALDIGSYMSILLFCLLMDGGPALDRACGQQSLQRGVPFAFLLSTQHWPPKLEPCYGLSYGIFDDAPGPGRAQASEHAVLPSQVACARWRHARVPVHTFILVPPALRICHQQCPPYHRRSESWQLCRCIADLALSCDSPCLPVGTAQLETLMSYAIGIYKPATEARSSKSWHVLRNSL